jgi:hypothetical protein
MCPAGWAMLARSVHVRQDLAMLGCVRPGRAVLGQVVPCLPGWLCLFQFKILKNCYPNRPQLSIWRWGRDHMYTTVMIGERNMYDLDW